MRSCIFLFCFLLCASPSVFAANSLPEKELTAPDDVFSFEDAWCRISIRVPRTGIDMVDRDSISWAKQQLHSFQLVCAEDKPETQYALDASCTLIRRGDAYISTVWNIFDYTGGAHSNADIQTRTYDLKHGKSIELYDLFSDLDKALTLLETLSSSALRKKMGEDMIVPEMLRDGTAPTAENFSRFAITDTGYVFYFPPYQVAPWAAGMQTVDIPFESIKSAGILHPRLPK